MAQTPTRIVGPQLVTNSAATVYTVPGATTTILRNIHVANTSASAATFFLSLGTDAAGKRLFSGQTIPANGSLDWTGNIPMAAAEILQSYSGTTNVLSVTIGALVLT